VVEGLGNFDWAFCGGTFEGVFSAVDIKTFFEETDAIDWLKSDRSGEE